MSDTAGYSPLHTPRGIVGSWYLPNRSLAVRLALLLAKSALVAVLYYLLVATSMKLRLSTSGLCLLWPSNALLVGTLALSPKRRWWAYLLAVVPAHIAAMSPYHVETPWLLYQIAFNLAVTSASAAVLQRFKPEIFYFEKLKEVLIFLAVAIAVPGLMCLAAVYPVVKFSSNAVLLSHNWSDGVLAVWVRGWINNLASFIAFVPTLLVCLTRGCSWFRGLSSRRAGEAVLGTVMFVVITLFVFGHVYTIGSLQQALYVIPIPLLLWAAVRFGPAGACLSISALVCISSWCARAGEGPFLRTTSIDRVTAMQISWLMIAAPLLSFAAVVREKKLATLSSLENERRFRQLFEQATVGVVVESPERQIRNVNPAFCKLLGYAEDELIGVTHSSFSNREDLEIEKTLFSELRDGERSSYQLEKRLLRKDGTEIWSCARVSLLREPGENSPMVLQILEDISARKIAESQLRQLTGRLIQAQEAERCRISRELHDDLGQQAAVLVNDLSVLRRELSVSERRPAAEQAAKLHQLASDLASEIHQLSHELHSSRLQHLGLAPALTELCTRISSQRPIAMQVRVDDLPQRMPRDIALCLFRVAQEALTNVIKHSQAKTVIIEGTREGTVVRLRISDDGVGFDPSVSFSGIGLTSMRERLRLVDGELLMNSSPNRGTEIIARVSFAAPRALAAHA